MFLFPKATLNFSLFPRFTPSPKDWITTSANPPMTSLPNSRSISVILAVLAVDVEVEEVAADAVVGLAAVVDLTR